MTEITSPANDRIKDLVRLWDRRARDATGSFLIEGAREVGRAVDAGTRVVELYLCPDLGGLVLETPAPVTTVSRQAFAKVSRRQNPDGVLAVAEQWPTPLDGIATSTQPLVLVADGIEKPGNLGAMLRVADAAGLDGVVVCDPVIDIFNPNVIRASQGSVFSVAVGTADADEVMEWLDRAGIHPLTTFPDATTPYTDVDLSAPSAIVVGAEATGLSDGWRDVGTAVALPMSGSADSLNAAIVAAVVAYEAVRQRLA
jgi:TrmH family RNA methyltransferase